jgi:excisionase family DNA binding protein
MAVVMNIEELSEKIKVSVSTLRKKVMRKQIPHTKIGGRVVFIEADIDRWLEGQAVSVGN